jgi:hypothetical protein
LEVMLKKTERIFEKHDVDGDGSLSVKEFQDLLREADKNLTALPATAQVASQQVTHHPLYTAFSLTERVREREREKS